MFSSRAMASFSPRSGVARPVSIFVTSDSVQPTRCASSSWVRLKRRRASRIAWPTLLCVFIGFVVCFAEGNPGYIPPASEFGFGGYDVDEAHRYYGMPASFAPGAAEALAAAAKSLIRNMNSGRTVR